MNKGGVVMINKLIIQKAKQQFKDETTKLVTELAKKREKTAAPSSPITPKDIIAKRSEFRQSVAKRVAELSKNQEYTKYLGTAQEDTITA